MDKETLSRSFSYTDKLLEDKTNFEEAIKYALHKIEENLEVFSESFPCSVSELLIYYPVKNTGWDTAFWTGMLWLAYEISGNNKFRSTAELQVESFKERLNKDIEIDCINIGRLYTLSCVAAYKITGSMEACSLAVEAAEKLKNRFCENGQYIFGWGRLGNENGSVIEAPSLIDLSLLYWASRETGNKKYHEVAINHLNQAIKNNIREDGSTFHQYYMDPATGKPLHALNMAGYSEKSCWARGQALCLYSLVLSYGYTGDIQFLNLSKKLTDYFLSHLPEDGICYWDLSFTEGHEPRDTSAAVIAASGMLELAKYLPVTDKDKYIYEHSALKILRKLIRDYTTDNEELSDSNGILTGGVYRKPFSYGENECLLMGDYFYLEALTKASRCQSLYW